MLKNINLPIALLAVGLLFALVIPMVLAPEGTAYVISIFYNIMTIDFPWALMLIAFLSAVFAIFIMFSKYGDIRLGGNGAKPHYKTFS